MKLFVMPVTLAVSRLAATEEIPAWAGQGSFFSITRTFDELSIVCDEALVPEGVKSEGSWQCLKVEGPLDFALTGILSSLVQPLAEKKISVFALSTFDTDYLLVKDFEAASAALRSAGHTVT